MITKKLRTPAISESVIQVAIVKALKKLDLEVYSCPNGGYRLSLNAALKLRAEGLTRGVPDLHILIPGGRIAYFEVKATKGRLSPEQIAFGNRAKQLGALWAEVRSVDDAMERLSEWGLLSQRETAA